MSSTRARAFPGLIIAGLMKISDWFNQGEAVEKKREEEKRKKRKKTGRRRRKRRVVRFHGRWQISTRRRANRMLLISCCLDKRDAHASRVRTIFSNHRSITDWIQDFPTSCLCFFSHDRSMTVLHADRIRTNRVSPGVFLIIDYRATGFL